ncbi:MAG TPA: ORF6N domain-containing protein [Bacteroidota bacterium]|nr:ORF6N domain-containing protein [Bacteroidota bacterium]
MRNSLIENRIFLIRGHKVMLGVDLAGMYQVETRSLNQAVKRNLFRFPPDFMFRLSKHEADLLVSQNVIPHRKYYGGSLPYAFTEQGVAMLSTVLRSKRAIRVNIGIMRAFVKLRELLSTHKELTLKLSQLEMKVESHDKEIRKIFQAIRQLMIEPEKPKRQMGF